MPDKVAFSTSNYTNIPGKPQEFSQGEWDSYYSSKFNGFPFATIEKAQDNKAFENWDQQTTFQGIPSKSPNRLISVLSDHYSYKFTFLQLFKLFWRLKGVQLKVGDWQDAESRSLGTLSYDNTGFANGYSEKNSELQLVANPYGQGWFLNLSGCPISIDFAKPVLKLGQDDFRPFINCGCCSPTCCITDICGFTHYFQGKLYAYRKKVTISEEWRNGQDSSAYEKAETEDQYSTNAEGWCETTDILRKQSTFTCSNGTCNKSWDSTSGQPYNEYRFNGGPCCFGDCDGCGGRRYVSIGEVVNPPTQTQTESINGFTISYSVEGSNGSAYSYYQTIYSEPFDLYACIDESFPFVYGCTQSNCANYDPMARCDDGSCIDCEYDYYYYYY